MKDFSQADLTVLIAIVILFMFCLLFLACVLVYFDFVKEYQDNLKKEQQKHLNNKK
jgi:cytochrome bd-type quinol oxidase subunit 1